MGATLKSSLGRIAREAEAKAAAVIERTALRVEAGAKARSRVDTGFMRGEWQVADGDDELEKRVVDAAEHTVYNEYGTRYMSAQPMAAPAAEDARPGFERGIREIFDGS